MNIELQCCALFIILTIAIMFMREKKLDLMNRKLFQRAIYVCSACLVFDITSIVLINMSVHSGFSQTVTSVVCKIYIMLLVMQGYIGYVYASTSLLPREETWAKAVRLASHFIFAVGEVLMLILPMFLPA